MDSLFLIFLLLGATTGDRPAKESGNGARPVAVASARILNGGVIRWGTVVSRAEAGNGHPDFETAPLRTTGESGGADGQTVHLQEFH